MGAKLLGFCLVSALLAYYLYTPIPEDIEEPWKAMLVATSFRVMGQLAEVADKLGLVHYMDTLMLLTDAEYVAPMSDENITVRDTEFSNVSVRLYLPKKPSERLRRAVVYFHGGGWCLGHAGMRSYDQVTRWTSDRLNAVVVSVNYRLAPQHRFPAQFEDVYTVTKFFLQSSVLSQYGVDPDRVCVSGDSAGGNLAAAVVQQLLEDPEVKTKIKVQALIYPALQTLDLNLPSYQDNDNKPILPRSLMIRFWGEYFTSDPSLQEAMATNSHVPLESSHLLQFVNWSKLLPEEMKRGHVYRAPVPGSPGLARRYPGFLDVRAAPLLAPDARLLRLPHTYVLTCQHDVLRDDGLMYVKRLRALGVPVTHHHAQDAFHGAMMFISWPMELAVGHRLLQQYIEWLDQNL
ncbi:arylacetamide deacetylase [Calypte anna]|uniref:arylacetamide deacetylase n=1 Tax=Calypte anna TaxID=9244 RepID=UPI0011C3AF6A|nr:arylacetamide deacetylase [Calypte anna]